MASCQPTSLLPGQGVRISVKCNMTREMSREMFFTFREMYPTFISRNVKNISRLKKYCLPFILNNLPLLKHIKSIHEGVKFPCAQCDYTATDQNSLGRHIKSIHEGVKFPCDQCEFKATRKGNLLKHKKSRHEKV